MPNSYPKTAWVDGVAPDINATNLNKIETAISNTAYAPDGAVNTVPVADGASGITWQQIGNAQVAVGAAITYSKLSLALSILNADISASAAIALSKLADPGSGKVVTSAGSGAVADFPPGYQLAYTEITSNVSVTATTEGTANTVVTSASFTADGTSAYEIGFYSSAVLPPATTNASLTFILHDGTNSLGFIGQVVNASTAGTTLPVLVRRRLTPSAGSKTYSVRAYVSTGTGTVAAGAGGAAAYMPAAITIRKS